MKNPNATTLAIKARLANIVRKALWYSRKANPALTPEQFLKTFTMENKVAFFDMIFKENTKTHAELKNYKGKRQYKALVQKLREERGYVPKKKTDKSYYEKVLQSRKTG